MASFDYMEFNNGDYVFHAGKYTPEKAFDIVKKEYGLELELSIDDVEEGYCRYLRKTPEDLVCDFGEGGRYVLCDRDKGAFPVLIIQF